MAKLVRENRLRERRLIKDAKREARKHTPSDHQTSSDHLDARETPLEAGMAQAAPPDPASATHEPAVRPPASDEPDSTPGHAGETGALAAD